MLLPSVLGSVLATNIVLLNQSSHRPYPVETQWVTRYSGVGSYVDEAKGIHIDNEGNIIITGSSRGEPGETEAGHYDIVTIKYNDQGVEQWIQRWDNQQYSLDDFASSMVIDSLGNIYIVGKSLVGQYLYSLVIIKYNALGEKQWEDFYYGGYSQVLDYPEEIVLDESGNLYVSGSVKGEHSQFDICVLKYSTSGQRLWVRCYDSEVNGNDTAQHLAVKNNAVVVVGEVATPEIWTDYVTLKYTDEGDLLWVKTYNYASTNEAAMVVAIDDSDNIYVTGSSNNGLAWYAYDYATIKYDPNGEVLWIQRYDGLANESPVASADFVNDMILNTDGNIIVSGKSSAWVNLTDCYGTVCYTTAGEQLWADRYYVYRGAPPALACDHLGNIYLGGSRAGGDTYHDFFTMRYNATGEVAWTETYNGPGNYWDKASDIAVGTMGNVYVTGFSVGVGTDEDYMTIKYHQVDEVAPLVTINSPQPGYLYVANHVLWKRFVAEGTFIVGKCTIDVSAIDLDSGVRNVEFSIDGVVRGNVNTPPYQYVWDQHVFSLNVHRINITVYDIMGNVKIVGLEVQKLF